AIITDGELNLVFDATGSDGVNQPKLSAIEILGSATAVNELPIEIVQKSEKSTKINGFAKENDLKIYPNPANIETTLSFDQPTTVGTIQIFDVTGRLVQTINGGLIDERGTPVNVQEMPDGVYFVKTTDSFGLEFQQKMLIQRQ
uniref:T9SS type A sorting domain-containing protein n=1 Tax=Maribacter litoralis TaxID=2059726 RepID=UPI003F5CD2AA